MTDNLELKLKKKYKILVEKEGTISIPTQLKIEVSDNDPLISKCLNHRYSIKILCDEILFKQKGLHWSEYYIDENIRHQNGKYIFHIYLNE